MLVATGPSRDAAGVMDEDGEWIADKDVHLGIEAYRERFARQK